MPPVTDCNECGWREELGRLRTAIESLDRQLEGVRDDYRAFRKARDSVANLSADQISDTTPPGHQREEMRIGPLRVRGRHAVAAVAIAVALIVSTALITHTVTADHFTAILKRGAAK